MKSFSRLPEFHEVFASYSLLFGQSVGGKDEARQLFGVPVNVSHYDGSKVTPDLSTPLKSLEIIHWTGKYSVASLKIR